MTVLDEEILNLWHLLAKHNVRYIMTGSFASSLHGLNDLTPVMKLWIKDTLENRKRLRAAIKELGLGDMAPLETMELVPGWSSIKLSSGFEVDLMSFLSGFEQADFDDCYKDASTAIPGDIPVKFLHINHLIQEKSKTSRPKDMLDVEELKKIRDRKS